MQKIINFLNANPWLNLLFLILAIASIFVSVILYLRSRKEKILVYTSRGFNLIHNSVVRIPGLSVRYENANIDTLTLTKVAFWNKGRGTINNADIAPTDRLSISPQEEVRILNAGIAYQSLTANNFSLEKSRHGIIVNFDYIDFHQGVIIDVYHTGQNSGSILFGGTVKGGHALHSGEIPEDYLFDKTFEPIIKKFKKIDSIIPRLLLFIIILPIIFIPAVILMPIDKVYGIMNRLPSEFDLGTKVLKSKDKNG